LELDEKKLRKISKIYSKYIMNYKIEETFRVKFDCNIELVLDLRSISIDTFKNHQSLRKTYRLYVEPIDKLSWNVQLESINGKSIDFKEANNIIFCLLLERIIANQTIYLPSTRLFLSNFYKYLLIMEKNFKYKLLNNLYKINKNNMTLFYNSYTKPVEELIKKLVFELDNPAKSNTYLKQLSNIIEGDISIKKDDTIKIADIAYQHKSGIEIPMYLSSSMVNQLSLIYLYFKYWYYEYNPNSFLIIDEPEMNLHPENKIKLLEILLDFASKNRLLIATHSTTIAKTIINYLHLFDLKEKKIDIDKFIKENDLNIKNIDLKSNDIGIYYFNGNTIISYKKDNDSDIHFGTFTEVEKMLENNYWTIVDKKDEFDSQDR